MVSVPSAAPLPQLSMEQVLCHDRVVRFFYKLISGLQKLV
jgi:hypothetical protein